jgi:hypothetical protein
MDGTKKDDGDKPKNNNFSKQKCYPCNKVGHMAWQFSEKDKETGLVVFTTEQTQTLTFVNPPTLKQGKYWH